MSKYFLINFFWGGGSKFFAMNVYNNLPFFYTSKKYNLPCISYFIRKIPELFKIQMIGLQTRRACS